MKEEKVGESRTTESLPKPLRVEEEWRARTVVVGCPGKDELEEWLLLLEAPLRKLEANAKRPTLARGDLGDESVEEVELSVDGVNWCWRKDVLVVVLLAMLAVVVEEVAPLRLLLLLLVLLLRLLLRSMAESAGLLLPEEARDPVLLCDDGGAVLAGPWLSASWTSCSFGGFLGLEVVVFVVWVGVEVVRAAVLPVMVVAVEGAEDDAGDDGRRSRAAVVPGDGS